MRDRDLVRLYWPAELRPAFDALFDIDAAMSDVVTKATEPALAAIKLAWWRERLAELDQGKVPAEPRLQAAAAELLPLHIRGAELAKLEEGWVALLGEEPDREQALRRGAILFDLAGRLLGGGIADTLALAGRLYVAGDLNRRGLPAVEQLASAEPARVPPRLRPLTGLAVLARRDLHRKEPEATPGRALALFRHRLTGRL